MKVDVDSTRVEFDDHSDRRLDIIGILTRRRDDLWRTLLISTSAPHSFTNTLQQKALQFSLSPRQDDQNG